MQQFLYILCFFLSVPLIAQDQEKQSLDKTEETIALYLESNGTMMQYTYAYSELLRMLENQFSKKESNKQGWDYLETNREEAMAAIKAGIIPIYKTHFELSEIEEMLAFYQSETGKKLVNDRANMSEQQKQELSKFYSRPTGQKIIEKQGILTQEISTVSEEWSRDLYETALSLLKDE